MAVTGPFQKAFTYHLPDQQVEIAPGTRVLVEFGRSRAVGFYLGELRVKPDFKTKPILRILDTSSYFPPDLFDLCLWMADYYYSNPADCLAAALPSVLRTRRSVDLVWAESGGTDLPDAIASVFKPGRRLTDPVKEHLRQNDPALLKRLIDAGQLVENWPVVDEAGRGVISGYKAVRTNEWTEFFAKRRFKPEPFGGQQDKGELFKNGWTEHYVKAASSAGLLKPVVTSKPDSILDFVPPKEGVTDLTLLDGQQAVFDSVTGQLDNGFSSSLLHGITGSGKTLVYCHIAREVLNRGRTALILTPEIALSGTTLAYFRGFFGDKVTVFHSAMTQRERLESWNGVRRGKYRIVIGPRSAVFAPLKDLGLIVVDEEHDGSYKQDDPAPRFHGRDSAVMRAKIADIPVLLGSASPSLESYHNARQGRYRLLELKERPGDARLPVVRIINMKKERLHGDLPNLSFPLKKEVDQRLERKEQVILFLNRRGYSPQLKCADCGHVPGCPHCDVKLTYHKAGAKLSCHYCGYLRTAYEKCEKCGGTDFQYPGTGTQKVEEQIARLFENAGVLRFDSDTASGRKSGHRMLRDFANRKHSLLLGTQMVTKGLDLPGVSLVGVLSADLGLDLPDFRSSEKTFARLLQVAGRSGRGTSPGEVLVQTYYPSNEVIQDAARQDYLSFFDRELESRRLLSFPPFSRMVKFVLSTADGDKLQSQTEAFAEQLRRRLARAGLESDILGPAPCPMPFLRGKARRQLFIRTKRVQAFTGMLRSWEEEQARFGLPSTVRLVIDIDPDDMM